MCDRAGFAFIFYHKVSFFIILHAKYLPLTLSTQPAGPWLCGTGCPLPEEGKEGTAGPVAAG